MKGRFAMKPVTALLVVALVAVVGVPFLLRPKRVSGERGATPLVIITPHNEALRFEYGKGFEKWYREKTGKAVVVDWRVIGGTSEIARYLESEYTTSFERYWTGRLGRPWSATVQAAYQAPRLASDAPPEAHEAREAFLASDVGCGIDLFFGGGPFDFARQAQAGRLVDSGVLSRHPEWFVESVIPAKWQGEDFWDAEGRWVGTVLSNYGILSNQDSLERLKMRLPTQWNDLGDPRLLGELALADPTKSGSIAKAFENLVQQQMTLALRRIQSDTTSQEGAEQRAVVDGWDEAMRLLQRMGGNARYFSDTSQKPPIDVSQGNAAVGVCIDFYGRQQVESVSRRSGAGRLHFRSPEGGTVSSVDPIGLLRGAPHAEIARAFIDYVLSSEGQNLWNLRPGTPGGPERYALRRMPVRRDWYERTVAETRSDPDVNPFIGEDALTYRPEWTGTRFRELSFIIRIMCLDTHPELRSAWKAVIEAGMPPEAMARLFDVRSVNYEAAGGRIKTALTSRNKVDEVRLANELANQFRQQYLEAERLARTATKRD